MPYRLNPNFVRDKESAPLSVWLRDPKNVGPEIFDVTIGDVVVDELTEDVEMANRIAATRNRIAADCNEELPAKVRVYHTTGCFGYEAGMPVTLVVDSKESIVATEVKV